MDTSFRDGVMRLLPALRGYAMILTRSGPDADDLVQDVLVRVWKYRDGFQAGTNLKAWVFRILRNQYLSHAQGAGRAPLSLNDMGWFEPSRAPDQEWRLLYSSLLEALDQLPFENREALLLVTASGFSYEEAAESCGCAVGTIKSRVSRARVRLAEIMDYEAPRRRHGRRRRGAHDIAASVTAH